MKIGFNLNSIYNTKNPDFNCKNRIQFKGRFCVPSEDIFSKNNHGAGGNEFWVEDPIMEAWRNDIYLRDSIYELLDGDVTDKIPILNVPDKLDFDYDALKNMDILNLYISDNKKGVRGSSIFSKDNVQHTKVLKQLGINRIIDLRGESNVELSKKICEGNNLEYFLFPVCYNNKTSQEQMEKLPEFIKLVNEGKFYMGCCEGTNRTDIAAGLKYVFDKDDKYVPIFRSGRPHHSLQMLQKTVNEIIGHKNDSEKEGVLELVQSLGWSDVASFRKDYKEKIRNITLYNIT